MLKRSQELTDQIDHLQTQISSLPDGNIFCSRNGLYTKWYHTDGHIPTYISKKNRTFAEQLAYKKYLMLHLQDLKQEKIATDFYIRHHKPNCAETLLTQDKEYLKLIQPYFQPRSKELTEWTNSSYNRNPKHPEQLLHKTVTGDLVRSKSESFIAAALYLNQIPFRYECILQLGSITLYPDFTIRHPVTGQTFYWEHFGLIEQPAYCKNTCEKLQLYMSHGIIPTITLITTYETSSTPLSYKTIEDIIRNYFLTP